VTISKPGPAAERANRESRAKTAARSCRWPISPLLVTQIQPRSGAFLRQTPPGPTSAKFTSTFPETFLHGGFSQRHPPCGDGGNPRNMLRAGLAKSAGRENPFVVNRS